MPKSHTRALVLATLLATAHAATIPTYFRRDGVCGGSPADKLSQCADGLDDGLCCQEGMACISLAGGSTVLCCPEGRCDRMRPITCNLSFQDPDVNPKGTLKTTALKSELPRCGDNCCPFGFSCNDGVCAMDRDQSQRPRELPESELPSSTALPSSIPSPSILPSTTGSSPSSTSSNSPPSEEQQGEDSEDGGNDTLPTAIIVVSVLGGLLGLICVAIGVVMCLARRKRKARMPPRQSSEKKGLGLCRASTSTSSFGNMISEPIPHQDSALRSDFILKTPESGASRASQRMSPGFRGEGSLGGTTVADNSPPNIASGLALGSKNNPRIPARTLSNATMTTSNHSNNLAIPPIRTMRNQQRPQINTGSAWTKHAAARAAVPDAATPIEPKGPVTPRLQREPSSESINIFADPSTVGRDGNNKLDIGGLQPPKNKRYTSATTFTDLMEEAQLGDVRRGNPFVPTTPGTTPRR